MSKKMTFEDKVEIFTPELVIGGAIKYANKPKNAFSLVVNHAAEILNTDDVAVVYSMSDGFIYWIACKAQDLAGHVNGGTPLSLALPGVPGYLGDGIYICSVDTSTGMYQIAISDTGRLNVMLVQLEGEEKEEVVRDKIEEIYHEEIRDLPFYNVSDVEPSIKWKTEKALWHSTVANVLKFSLIPILFGIVGLGAFDAYVLYKQDQSEKLISEKVKLAEKEDKNALGAINFKSKKDVKLWLDYYNCMHKSIEHKHPFKFVKLPKTNPVCEIDEILKKQEQQKKKEEENKIL